MYLLQTCISSKVALQQCKTVAEINLNSIQFQGDCEINVSEHQHFPADDQNKYPLYSVFIINIAIKAQVCPRE